MKNATKGLLLSGLVMPGLGQIVLKSYKKGAVLILAVLAAVFVIIAKSVQAAFLILEKIEKQGGPLDMDTVAAAADRAVGGFDTLVFNIAFGVLLFCWIAGMVDAYLIGRKKDADEI